MNKEYYIKRNEKAAKSLYGNKIDSNKKVNGTNIWFDIFWRMHIKK